MTAYDMRISDWSADVCSSDLPCARQYFAGEAGLREAIDRLWQAVDWSWHTRDGQEVLYWHWSPRHDWAMDHPIRGWNECLITYEAGTSASSPMSWRQPRRRIRSCRRLTTTAGPTAPCSATAGEIGRAHV